nr:ribonuclease H-like domain-containing protein [Tanacetum cinerariifolium]
MSGPNIDELLKKILDKLVLSNNTNVRTASNHMHAPIVRVATLIASPVTFHMLGPLTNSHGPVYYVPPAQPVSPYVPAQPVRTPPTFTYPPAQLYSLVQQAILAQQCYYPGHQFGHTGSIVIPGQERLLPHAFNTVNLQDLVSGAWNIDTGASSHLNNSVNSLSENFNMCMYPSISVGDCHPILATNTGHSILPTPTKSLHLNNVLITPHIVKNLIYVRQFVCDNNCTIQFDAFGFFVKDFLTRQVLLRCDSTGDLYPATTPFHIPHDFLVSQYTWHQRLSHPEGEVLRHLVSSNFISYKKKASRSMSCLSAW